MPFRMKNKDLILELQAAITSEPSRLRPQDLDGTWLFVTRGPGMGQDGRGGESSRKTLKFLMGGTFQWIAYDTKSFKFFGLEEAVIVPLMDYIKNRSNSFPGIIPG